MRASRDPLGCATNGTGLADLMAAAGLTHGGFYKHFESKEQVVEESLVLAVDSMIEAMQQAMAAAPGSRGVDTAMGEYLSVDHRDDAADGCPFVALGSEFARGGTVVREAATKGFLEMVDTIASQVEGVSPAAARNEALFILTSMIGAVTLARVVNDPVLSATILRQARKHLSRSSA